MQWLLIGLVLRGLWGVVRLFTRTPQNSTPRREGKTAGKQPKKSKPPWDPNDVVEVGYEEVPRKSKSQG